MHALGLSIRAVWPTDLGPLIPAESEPPKRVQQRLVGLLAVTSAVGVFDTEDERATRVTGVRPVE